MARLSKKSNLNPYLPEELIIKILSWTNGTSLLRFKSVCKSWYSIISDDKFIESHRTNSLKNPSILMITYNMDIRPRPAATNIIYTNSSKNSMDLHLPSSFYRMKFVSSCNGIVCVRNFRGDDIYLWNPLTRMSKRLPIINIHEEPSYSRLPLWRRVAYGFCCVSCDFKVLKITYKGDDLIKMGLPKVYLYSSNANSWREIDKANITLPKIMNLITLEESGLVVDGVVYFGVQDKIVTFDLHNEILGSIPYPKCVQLQRRRKLGVFDFEGSVAVMFEAGESVDSKFSLWTMEVVSGKVFWKQTLSFDAGLRINWVSFYSGAEQFIGNTTSGEMFCYDYKKKETKYFEPRASQRLDRLLNHTESFLSIEGFEHAE